MKYLRLLVVVVMLLALVYVLDKCADTSSLDTPAVTPTAQPATAPTPNKMAAPKPAEVVAPVLHSAQTEPPAIAATTPAIETPQTEPTPEPTLDPANPQPQAKLEDAISLAVMVYENGDFLNMAKLMKPNASPEEQAAYAETLRSAPNAMALNTLRVQALQTTQFQTPELNADGTQAVYNFNPPIGPFTGAIFVKENGLWHKM